MQRCRVLLFAFVAVQTAAIDCRFACAQADGAKSTLRFISAPTGPAPGPTLDAPEQGSPQPAQPEAYGEPRELVPQGPVEHIRPQQSPPAQASARAATQSPPTNNAVASPAHPTPRRSPVVIPSAVRQASYNEPASNSSGLNPANGRAPSMVNVYAGANAQATLSQMPRPAPVGQRTIGQPLHQRGKPFTTMQTTAPISPYLSMYRSDANNSLLPNYFAYVQPQLQQQEAAHQQAAEIEKLQKQVQNLSQGNGAAPNSASMTAHAHYMDTGQFFHNPRRTP